MPTMSLVVQIRHMTLCAFYSGLINMALIHAIPELESMHEFLYGACNGHRNMDKILPGVIVDGLRNMDKILPGVIYGLIKNHV